MVVNHEWHYTHKYLVLDSHQRCRFAHLCLLFQYAVKCYHGSLQLPDLRAMNHE